MMSQGSKRELWETIQPRYLKASKAEKQKILDEFTAATGYHRKYAIRILRHGYPRGQNKQKGKKPIYRGEVVVALGQIWEVYGCICSKRLHPFLPEGINVLERCGEIKLTPEVKQLLLRMSRATQLLYEELQTWRNRPLGEVVYLYLDARYEKVRQADSVRDAAILIAKRREKVYFGHF